MGMTLEIRHDALSEAVKQEIGVEQRQRLGEPPIAYHTFVWKGETYEADRLRNLFSLAISRINSSLGGFVEMRNEKGKLMWGHPISHYPEGSMDKATLAPTSDWKNGVL